MSNLESRSHLPPTHPTTYTKSLRDEITPEPLYMSRRLFIAGLGALSATAFLSACTPFSASNMTSQDGDETIPGNSDNLTNDLTPYDDIANYNNFYEFSYGKEGIAELAENFQTSPWTVSVGGLVDNPGDYSIEDLIKKYPPEERIYRMRCVEAWSMVIPWTGFPLHKLLADVKPQPEARFVRFESFYDPAQMPGDKSLPFPYYEGLRLDEANHDLTILATGLYDKPLPRQDGAPIRLVVPWKYGFKSAKSIQRITLLPDMPSTFWADLSPNEYGFYANVNPNVDHPRWSQSTERRIGELKRRPTLMFNGYDEVASLYEGMDLRKFF
jgi:sulfoxide reductase catalytic subunit YedY